MPGEFDLSAAQHRMSEDKHIALYIGQDGPSFPRKLLVVFSAKHDVARWRADLRKKPLDRRVMIIQPKGGKFRPYLRAPFLPGLAEYLDEHSVADPRKKPRVFCANFTNTEGLSPKTRMDLESIVPSCSLGSSSSHSLSSQHLAAPLSSPTPAHHAGPSQKSVFLKLQLKKPRLPPPLPLPRSSQNVTLAHGIAQSSRNHFVTDTGSADILTAAASNPRNLSLLADIFGGEDGSDAEEEGSPELPKISNVLVQDSRRHLISTSAPGAQPAETAARFPLHESDPSEFDNSDEYKSPELRAVQPVEAVCNVVELRVQDTKPGPVPVEPASTKRIPDILPNANETAADAEKLRDESLLTKDRVTTVPLPTNYREESRGKNETRLSGATSLPRPVTSGEFIGSVPTELRAAVADQNKPPATLAGAAESKRARQRVYFETCLAQNVSLAGPTTAERAEKPPELNPVCTLQDATPLATTIQAKPLSGKDASLTTPCEVEMEHMAASPICVESGNAVCVERLQTTQGSGQVTVVTMKEKVPANVADSTASADGNCPVPASPREAHRTTERPTQLAEGNDGPPPIMELPEADIDARQKGTHGTDVEDVVFPEKPPTGEPDNVEIVTSKMNNVEDDREVTNGGMNIDMSSSVSNVIAEKAVVPCAAEGKASINQKDSPLVKDVGMTDVPIVAEDRAGIHDKSTKLLKDVAIRTEPPLVKDVMFVHQPVGTKYTSSHGVTCKKDDMMSDDSFGKDGMGTNDGGVGVPSLRERMSSTSRNGMDSICTDRVKGESLLARKRPTPLDKKIQMADIVVMGVVTEVHGGGAKLALSTEERVENAHVSAGDKHKEDASIDDLRKENNDTQLQDKKMRLEAPCDVPAKLVTSKNVGHADGVVFADSLKSGAHGNDVSMQRTEGSLSMAAPGVVPSRNAANCHVEPPIKNTDGKKCTARVVADNEVHNYVGSPQIEGMDSGLSKSLQTTRESQKNLQSLEVFHGLPMIAPSDNEVGIKKVTVITSAAPYDENRLHSNDAMPASGDKKLSGFVHEDNENSIPGNSPAHIQSRAPLKDPDGQPALDKHKSPAVHVKTDHRVSRASNVNQDCLPAFEEQSPVVALKMKVSRQVTNIISAVLKESGLVNPSTTNRSSGSSTAELCQKGDIAISLSHDIDAVQSITEQDDYNKFIDISREVAKTLGSSCKRSKLSVVANPPIPGPIEVATSGCTGKDSVQVMPPGTVAVASLQLTKGGELPKDQGQGNDFCDASTESLHRENISVSNYSMLGNNVNYVLENSMEKNNLVSVLAAPVDDERFCIAKASVALVEGLLGRQGGTCGLERDAHAPKAGEDIAMTEATRTLMPEYIIREADEIVPNNPGYAVVESKNSLDVAMMEDVGSGILETQKFKGDGKESLVQTCIGEPPMTKPSAVSAVKRTDNLPEGFTKDAPQDEEFEREADIDMVEVETPWTVANSSTVGSPDDEKYEVQAEHQHSEKDLQGNNTGLMQEEIEPVEGATGTDVPTPVQKISFIVKTNLRGAGMIQKRRSRKQVKAILALLEAEDIDWMTRCEGLNVQEALPEVDITHILQARRKKRRIVALIRDAGPKILRKELARDLRQNLYEHIGAEVESVEELMSILNDFEEIDSAALSYDLCERLARLDVYECFSGIGGVGYGPACLDFMLEEFQKGRMFTVEEVVVRFREICADLINFHDSSALEHEAANLLRNGNDLIYALSSGHRQLIGVEQKILRMGEVCERGNRIGYVTVAGRSGGKGGASTEQGGRDCSVTFMNCRDEKGHSVMAKAQSTRVLGVAIDLRGCQDRIHQTFPCHLCKKQVTEASGDMLKCSNYMFGFCSEVVCRVCAMSVFGMDRAEYWFVRNSEKWVCVHCSGSCAKGTVCFQDREHEKKRMVNMRRTRLVKVWWKDESCTAGKIELKILPRRLDGTYHQKSFCIPLRKDTEGRRGMWSKMVQLLLGTYRCHVYVDGENFASTTLSVFPEVVHEKRDNSSGGGGGKETSILNSMYVKGGQRKKGHRRIGWKLSENVHTDKAWMRTGAANGFSSGEGCRMIQQCSRTEGYNWRRGKYHGITHWVPQEFGEPWKPLGDSKQSEEVRLTVSSGLSEALVERLSIVPSIEVGQSQKEWGIEVNSHLYEIMKTKVWGIVPGRSDIHGIGLFTMTGYERGDIVIEYAGDLIRTPFADIREREYQKSGLGTYLFRLNDEQIVDATVHSNRARFTNHSCDPNMNSEIVMIHGRELVVLRAIRYIPQYAELTFDYKLPYEDDHKLQCLCNASNCVGVMN